VGHRAYLQLYCQAPGCWHPTQEGGCYEIKFAADWISAVAPYLQKMISVLKYVAPLAGRWVAMSLPEYENLIKKDVEFMKKLVERLTDLREPQEVMMAEAVGEMPDPERAGGAALRAVRQLLDEKDKSHHWGGLEKVLTPEGHYLWLCEHHAKEYTI